jgi:hypothetical protein
MVEKLEAPKESEDVKNAILYMWVEIGKTRLGDSIPTDPERKGIWSGSTLPEYLWAMWKDELGRKGFTHQKFLRLMKYRTDDVFLWAYNRIPWSNLVARVIESIEGPMGKAIVEGSPLY